MAAALAAVTGADVVEEGLAVAAHRGFVALLELDPGAGGAHRQQLEGRGRRDPAEGEGEAPLRGLLETHGLAEALGVVGDLGFGLFAQALVLLQPVPQAFVLVGRSLVVVEAHHPRLALLPEGAQGAQVVVPGARLEPLLAVLDLRRRRHRSQVHRRQQADPRHHHHQHHPGGEQGQERGRRPAGEGRDRDAEGDPEGEVERRRRTERRQALPVVGDQRQPLELSGQQPEERRQEERNRRRHP